MKKKNPVNSPHVLFTGFFYNGGMGLRGKNVSRLGVTPGLDTLSAI